MKWIFYSKIYKFIENKNYYVNETIVSKQMKKFIIEQWNMIVMTSEME